MTKINQPLLARYHSLLGYKINEGREAQPDAYYSVGKRVLIREADEPQPAVDPQQGYAKKSDAPADPATPEQSAGDAMIPDMSGVEAPPESGAAAGISMEAPDSATPAAEQAADAAASREDILSQLVKLHAESLKQLEAFAQNIGPRVAGVEGTVALIPDLQGHLGQLDAQVAELTPPTPLQAMDKIVQASGGEKPEDWWNRYWADHNQQARLAGSPYYPKQKGDQPGPQPGQKVEYVLNPAQLPPLSPQQASDSFQSPRSY